MKKIKDLFGDDAIQPVQDEFATLLALSDHTTQKKLKAGDRITGEILTLGKDESFVSTGSTVDGLILTSELKDAEDKLAYKVGDKIEVYVTQIKGGEVRLSKKASGGDADSLEDAFDCMIPVEGKVTEVCNGGFRVNVMGKTAFCPISQMDSRHIAQAADYVGKKFDFMITQFEKSGRNIIVSRRKVLDQQKEESAAAFTDDHKVGEIVKGIVTRLEKFGAFVEVAPGLEGLVHISELSWSRISDPTEAVNIGDSIQVKILKVEDLNGQLKISLSYKQASEAPWTTANQQLKVGEILTGTVTQCLKFGAFVQVLPGIEGLVPLSEMSYTKRVMRSDELIKPGDKVRVLLKEVNLEDHKLLLSLRDAEGDPWVMVNQKYPIGRVLPGIIEKKENFGLLISLEPGVIALLPKGSYRDLTENPYEHAKIGDTVNVQIAEVLFEDRKMRLSPPKDGDDGTWQEFTGQAKSFGNSFADQLKGLNVKK
jgi:small subunit ribosomal protein S1